MQRAAKSLDRARWLPKRMRLIARSARNFVCAARDRSRVKFSLQYKRIATNFFPRLSCSRNKFITFTWPRTSYFQERISTERDIRGARDMASKREYIDLILALTNKLHRTDRNPDKLIVQCCVRSNC